jgi:glutathione reductase (NADPH)
MRSIAPRCTVGTPRLDWTALIDRETAMIKDIPDRLGEAMAGRGVEVVRGRAAFVAPNAVKVGDRTLEARHIVVATGSKPRALPIPGAEHLITSDAVLSERTRPQEVVFIGGGVIALEFSHIYARAGTKVTILETLPRLLAALDGEAVARIRAETERIGVDIRTGVTVRRIEANAARLRVVFEQNGAERTVAADRVVNGAGRVADVDALDLAAGGVAHDGTRVTVDDHLRSVSNPAVYVCGDALWSTPQLSPIATYEGQVTGRNIVDGTQHRPDYLGIPSCVYTIPALASVGLTEAKAGEQGLKIRVMTTDMASWLSARTYAETAAWAKIIIEESTDLILGAHIVGHAGEELIHFFALAMRKAVTAGELREMIYGFPTFSADIKNLL